MQALSAVVALDSRVWHMPKCHSPSTVATTHVASFSVVVVMPLHSVANDAAVIIVAAMPLLLGCSGCLFYYIEAVDTNTTKLARPVVQDTVLRISSVSSKDLQRFYKGASTKTKLAPVQQTAVIPPFQQVRCRFVCARNTSLNRSTTCTTT